MALRMYELLLHINKQNAEVWTKGLTVTALLRDIECLFKDK